jgi:large subunit ribosomal protein L30
MLKITKDFITWGEVDKGVLKLLLEKRAKLPGNKPLTGDYVKEKLKLDLDKFVEDYFTFKKELKDIPGLKLFFRLKPPIKGFERKGIKKPFSLGGALGYRKEKINDLIKRMI